MGGKHTSSDGVAINLPCAHAVLSPDGSHDGANQGSVGEHGRRNDPREGDGAPVGEPVAVLLALSDQVLVADNGLDHGNNTHDNRKYAAGKRDRDVGNGHGLGDGGPGGNRGNHKGAVLGEAGVVDARVGGCEEHKEAGGEPDGEECADGLRDPLLDGGGTNLFPVRDQNIESMEVQTYQEAGSEIGCQFGSNTSTAGGETTGHQVELLGVEDGVAGAGRGTAKDELRCLGCGSEGRLVGDGADLDGEEGEEEGEDDGQDGKAGVHFPLEVENNHGQHSGEDGARHPDPVLDLLMGRCGILDEVAVVGAGGLLGKELAGLSAGKKLVVDGDARLAPRRLHSGPNNLVLCG